MPGMVAIVTDSTACLPPQIADAMGIVVVSQQLRIGENGLDEETRVPRDQVERALRAKASITTSPPDPGAFFWAYQDAAARGASEIVSVHVSGQLSQTCDTARQAAEQTQVPVHVIDSGTLGMSLGYAVLAAASWPGRAGCSPKSRPWPKSGSGAAPNCSTWTRWTTCGAAGGSAPPRI
jgi:DegV family protein with EDD domain